MKTIGIISDTHTTFDNKLMEFLKDVDELWHAGDIGNIQTFDYIAAFKPLKAVYGNIDDTRVRICTSEYANFECEGMKILMTHIGGYPQHYYPALKQHIRRVKPDVVITGHSHILRVMYDKEFDHMHINPGAAGAHGFHKVRTAIRAVIEDGKITSMEVGEWDRI